MTLRDAAAVRPELPVPAEAVVGRVLPVPAGKCRYRDDGFVLRVSRVRVDVSLWYAGQWVWLEGEDLGQTEPALRWLPVLVHVSVLAAVEPQPLLPSSPPPGPRATAAGVARVPAPGPGRDG